MSWVLFVDQASNAAGVALTRDGELYACDTVCSTRSSDVISQRLQDQVPRLTDFLNTYVPMGENITKVVFEGVRSRIVLISVGAFLMCPRIKARLSPTGNFVESRSWKAWAKRQGATGPIKDIKGRKALFEIRPELFKRFKIDTDDAADSILMALTWHERNQ